jgi:hypothetical protein
MVERIICDEQVVAIILRKNYNIKSKNSQNLKIQITNKYGLIFFEGIAPMRKPFCVVPFVEAFSGMDSNDRHCCAAYPQISSLPGQTFEQWQQENSKSGLGGGLVDEQSSGLLTEQLFNQNHRYYYVDLSRRENSGDGASQSIQVAFSNPGRYSMKVICIVLYEKKWVIDTALCKVSSAV